MLGVGGFGKVHLDSKGHALKCIADEHRAMALHEARILRLGRGVAGVPRLYGVRVSDDGVVLRMDYRGPALTRGSCTPGRLRKEVGRTICQLHSLGIVHRDIKPANILVHPNHGLTLCDFGMATDASKAADTSVAGTAGWRAPIGLDARSRDVWQLLLVAKWLSGAWCFRRCAADLVASGAPSPSLTDKYAFWANMSSYVQERA